MTLEADGISDSDKGDTPQHLSPLENVNESKTQRVSRYEHKATQSRRSSRKFLWEYKVTVREYMNETSPAERELLRAQLNDVVTHFLSLSRSVYLEKFGLLVPIISEEQSVHQMGTKNVIRKDKLIRVLFEKSSELIQLHRDQHPNVVELPELTRFLYARLPIEQQAIWDEKRTRWLLRGLIRAMRNEVVVDGYSSQLSKVGDFFALHNRQGDNAEDWYAGANILLRPHLTIPLQVEVCAQHEQPVLDSAWELLEAGFGAKRKTISIDLAEELEHLGYDKETFSSQLPSEARSISVAVFDDSTDAENPGTILCSEGLRFFAHHLDKDGVELIVQVKNSDLDEEYLFVKRLMSLGWILMQTRKDKSLIPGIGLSADIALCNQPQTELTGIFCTPYQRIPLYQRGTSGRFRYMNVLGVTDDELRFSELRSPEHLLSLMRCKGMDQCSAPRRKSIFAKGQLSPVSSVASMEFSSH